MCFCLGDVVGTGVWLGGVFVVSVFVFRVGFVGCLAICFCFMLLWIGFVVGL